MEESDTPVNEVTLEAEDHCGLRAKAWSELAKLVD